MIFFGLLRATEGDECAASGFDGRHAGAEIFIDGEIEVVRHLGFEFGVEGVATEVGGDAMEEAEVHG
jgi:hypothetical protein